MQRILLLVGDVNDADTKSVTDLAYGRGFTVVDAATLLEPGALVHLLARNRAEDYLPIWSDRQLQAMKLPEAIDNPTAQGRLRRLFGRHEIGTALHLTKITFAAFIRPEQGITEELHTKALVLEFMIQNRISFANLNPAAAFPTRIVEVPPLQEMSYRLAESGVLRLELLAFYRAEHLRHGIENMGPATVGVLERELKARGLRFSS